MKRLLWTGLISVLCFLFTACHHDVTPFADMPVSIGKCAAANDPTLSLKAKNQVIWTAQDAAYTVVFPNPGANPPPGTPFRDSNGQAQYNFPIGQGNMVTSGSAAPTTDPQHFPLPNYYKYSIYKGLIVGQPPQGTQPCQDPGLHVKD